MTINQLKIKDRRSTDNIIKFMNKIEQWNNFNLDQPCSVFYADDQIIAFESEQYSWGFLCTGLKPSSMLKSQILLHIPYRDLRLWVDTQDLPF